jgi:hypothetical protein
MIWKLKWWRGVGLGRGHGQAHECRLPAHELSQFFMIGDGIFAEMGDPHEFFIGRRENQPSLIGEGLH